jgi:RHS repeat-associated protein
LKELRARNSFFLFPMLQNNNSFFQSLPRFSSVKKCTYHAPFGCELKGRNLKKTGLNKSFRFGFQGQEGDDEIKGDGNSVNYKYRMHDPRLGRFFAVDPLSDKYPWNSTYAFSENKLINCRELEGLEANLTIHQDNIHPDETNLVLRIYMTILDERKDQSTPVSKLGSTMTSDIQDTYKKWDSDGKVEFYSLVTFDYVKVETDAKYTVILHIVDVVPPPANDPSADMTGVKGRVETVGDEKNGTQVNHIYIRADVISSPDKAFRRTIPHEIGHFLGLRHPSVTLNFPDPAGDPKSDITAEQDPQNLMRQSRHTDGFGLKKSQINKIIRTIVEQTNKKIYEGKNGQLTREKGKNGEFKMD